MSDLFISYKREDETRVARLVEALQKEGFSLWWDRGLPGAENWRSNIQAALDAAKCAIVVWTENSVGPAGDFVRDEAGQAKARGILVPVMLEKVRQPLGFGEVQAFDLTGWRGNMSDVFFRDVVAAVRAKLAGAPVPAPKGPMGRIRARLTAGSIATALVAGAWAFLANTGLQEEVCQIPIVHPGLSDLCGALNFGNRPTRAERLDWESLRNKDGDCNAVRGFIAKYPGGRLRGRADAVLAARKATTTESRAPGDRYLDLLVGEGDAPAKPNEAAARADALARAQAPADRQCRDFEASVHFKLVGATPEPETWKCDPVAGGIVCGFEGRARCQTQETVTTEHETCPGGGK